MDARSSFPLKLITPQLIVMSYRKEGERGRKQKHDKCDIDQNVQRICLQQKTARYRPTSKAELREQPSSCSRAPTAIEIRYKGKKIGKHICPQNGIGDVGYNEQNKDVGSQQQKNYGRSCRNSQHYRVHATVADTLYDDDARPDNANAVSEAKGLAYIGRLFVADIFAEHSDLCRVCRAFAFCRAHLPSGTT